MSQLPKKITPDAIREALFEVRFEHDEFAELVLGPLANNPAWRGFSKSRLPGGEMPEQLRAAEPNLRYLPWMEFRGPGGNELIRIGSNSVTHHIVGSYIGWDSFLPKLVDTVGFLLKAIPSVKVSRFGLRYINALTASEHFVSDIYGLNLRVEVEGEPPSKDVQLVYQVDGEPDLKGIVRVVSPCFLEGNIPPETVAVIDVDITTEHPRAVASPNDVREWLDRAHDLEKESFFRLLRPETITRLTER